MTVSILESCSIKEIEVHCWSNSTTVLAWICRESNWSTFVYNRVKEIRQFSNPEQWHHVPGERNPADLPSTGCTVKQLIASQWWEGPSWLYECENWPVKKPLCDEAKVVKELKSTVTKANVSVCSFFSATAVGNENCSFVTADAGKKSCGEKLWDLDRFPNYKRVLRVVSWVKRFVHNAKRIGEFRKKGYIRSDEMSEAVITIIKMLQAESFSDLEDGRIKHLRPFYDEVNVIRLNTRVIYRDDTYNFKCPIILPAKHRIVTFIIEEGHTELKHAGIHSFILGGRKAIRSVIKKCMH